MASSDVNICSSLLRLGTQEWTIITCFLGSGDLLRLLSSGSSALERSLRQGHRYFKATWTSPRYIDLDQVVSASSLDNVLSFSFSSMVPSLRSWSPADPGSLFPKSVTELALEFQGCIDLLLGSGTSIPVSERFPLLLSLRLVDEHRASRLYKASILQLDTLPSSLHDLSLRSVYSSFKFPRSLFTTLPAGLTTLNIGLAFLELATADDETSRWTLCSLPPQLTFLKLPKCAHWQMDINLALLPRTLQHFEYDGLPHSSVISSVPASLPLLHTLIWRQVNVPIAEVALWFPSSLTHLEIGLNSAGCDDVAGALRTVSTALVGCVLRDPELNRLILSEAVSLPRLRELHTGPRSTPYIQRSIKKLWVREFEGDLPQGLEVCHWTLNRESSSILTATYPNTLRILYYPRMVLLPSEIVVSFPASLEELHGKFDLVALKALFQRIQLGELPNLSKVQSFAHVPCDLDLIPSQLRSLSLFFLHESLSTLTQPHFLSSLRHSELETLGLEVTGKRLEDAVFATLMDLLKNLPDSLKNLNLRAPRVLTADWPLKLPPRLQEFSFQATGELNPPASSCDSTTSELLYFPPSLIFLTTLFQSALPMDCLPPHLSFYVAVGTDGRQLQHDYFLTRSPPRAGQSLL